MKIGVLGAGAYGAALAGILRENGHGVRFYDPVKLPNSSLDSVLAWAETILLATPAHVVRLLLDNFPPEAFLKPALVATKGLMSLETWEQFRYFELISGPGFADDIRKRKKTKLTVAARRALEGQTLAESLLSTPYLKFDKTEDLTGVALLSGLKNLFAIESGRRGLKPNDPQNPQDFKDFIASAYRECEQTLLLNGGFVETVRLSAGLGDLALTCGSTKSRNYQFGTLLASTTPHSNRLKTNLSRAKNTKALKHFLKTTTVEGVFAAQEIATQNIFVPKDNEILTDILRRIHHATQR